MQNRTDAELLHDFAATHSEAAFNEIVRRYADAVYSAALRQVNNEHQARDVAQTVFVDLARKAGSLKPNTLLIGWLHRGARLAALELLRMEQRRFNREQQAMELHNPSPETEGDWSAIRPVLDEAIAHLGDEDRNALLLRFFKNESLSSVGATLGVSEDAAQKRVSRALDKLRDFLAARGIKTTAAALSVTLAANSIQSAPGGFAGTLAARALTKTAIGGGASTPYFLTLSNLKMACLVVVLTGGLAALIISKGNVQRRLQSAQAILEQQTNELAALKTGREQLTTLSNELQRARSNSREVLRLRAEVTALQRDLASSRKLLQAGENAARTEPPKSVPQINVRAKVFAVPALLAPADSTQQLLTEPQFKAAMEKLEQADGKDAHSQDFIISSQVEVTTLSGQQAQIETDLFQTSDSRIRFVLDLIPSCDTNLSQITFDRLSSVLLKVNLNADDPGAMVAISDEPPADAVLSVPAAQPGLALTLFSLTNSVILRDAHTLLFTKRLPDELKPGTAARTQPESLMIFVTPTMIDAAGNRISRIDTSEPGQADTKSHAVNW